MAYLGRQPLSGEVIIMNSIESQFNGVKQNFVLHRTISGITEDFYPAQTHQLLVSLGGVIQKPDPTGDTGFRINFNQIIFAVAPIAGTSCFIVSYGHVLDIGTPADGTVTPEKLSTGGPSWNTGSTLTTNPIQMNPNSISVDAVIPTDYNASTIGPTISINTGVSVTVQSGGTWTIT